MFFYILDPFTSEKKKKRNSSPINFSSVQPMKVIFLGYPSGRIQIILEWYGITNEDQTVAGFISN
jgi:pyrrolidone-carboxylate peptidase